MAGTNLGTNARLAVDSNHAICAEWVSGGATAARPHVLGCHSGGQDRILPLLGRAVVMHWLVLLMVLFLAMLSGCNGYPRFDPATCSTLEIGGEPSGLWVCQ